MIRIIYFAFIILLISCSGNQQEEKADNTEPMLNDSSYENSNVPDSSLTMDIINFFDTTGYSNYMRENMGEFNWNSFKLIGNWQEDSLLVFPFIPDEDYYKKYGRLIKYSPDSNYFLDLDSYQIDISIDKNGKMIPDELGPDTEISLINTINKTKTRLAYFGPAGSIEDGTWIDNETIALAGWAEVSSDSLKALIYKIHIPTGSYYVYEFADSGNARKLMGEWRKKRLEKLNSTSRD